MTWWLSLNAAQLRDLSTCTNCGCSDADISIGLCYECFITPGPPQPCDCGQRSCPECGPEIAAWEDHIRDLRGGTDR